MRACEMEDDIERLSILKSNIIHVTKQVKLIRLQNTNISYERSKIINLRTQTSKACIHSILKNYESQITLFESSLQRDSNYYAQQTRRSLMHTKRQYALTSSDINNNMTSSVDQVTTQRSTNILLNLSHRDTNKLLLKKYFLVLLHNLNGKYFYVYCLFICFLIEFCITYTFCLSFSP